MLPKFPINLEIPSEEEIIEAFLQVQQIKKMWDKALAVQKKTRD
jgi:hypothetical protein